LEKNVPVRRTSAYRHKKPCFNLQAAKKLQLIDSAACRKLRFKLAEMNFIDFCIMKEKQ